MEARQGLMQVDGGSPAEMSYESSMARIPSQTALSEEESSEAASNEGTVREESPDALTGDVCRVCGDAQAKMHYGVLACFGCKGFFRRALKRANQYECNNQRRCVIDKSVRPDRDFTGPQHTIRLPLVKRPIKEECHDEATPNETSEWSKRLPVEMRTMLMTLLNIEAKVTKGDTKKKAEEVYPLPEHTLRELIDDPSKLKGLRTEGRVVGANEGRVLEMRYEPYRMAENSELLLIAYRRLIAAVDWVAYLSDMMGGICVDDKVGLTYPFHDFGMNSFLPHCMEGLSNFLMGQPSCSHSRRCIALVKSCFAPLLVFTFAVRTAEVTDDPHVLCLCNFSFVPRDMANAYTDSYHLSNGIVERALNELVTPLRNLKLKQEEIVCLNATLVLNPHARDLSPEGSQKVIELRSRVQDSLYHVIKESRSKDRAPVQFGNLLLFLPIVTLIANGMSENLQFAQTFSIFGGIPLLTNLFGCFPVEPFSDLPLHSVDSDVEMEVDDDATDVALADAAVQTEPIGVDEVDEKRGVEPSLWSPIENPEDRGFKLLQPPCAYTLTEMFDDANTDTRDQFVAQMKDQEALLESSVMGYASCSGYSQPACAPDAGGMPSLDQSSMNRRSSHSIPNTNPSTHRRRTNNMKGIASSPVLHSLTSTPFYPGLPLPPEPPLLPHTSFRHAETNPMPIPVTSDLNELYPCSAPDTFMHNRPRSSSDRRSVQVPYSAATALPSSRGDLEAKAVTRTYAFNPYSPFSNSFGSTVRLDVNPFSCSSRANLKPRTTFGM